MAKKITKKGLKKNVGKQVSLTRKEYTLEEIVGTLCYSGYKSSGDGFLVPVGTGEFYVIPKRRNTPKSYYEYSPYNRKNILVRDGDAIKVIRSSHRQLNQKYTTIRCYETKYVVSL